MSVSRRVDAVGAGVAVGDQPRDRVVEIVDAADVVLGPAGQHHRLVEPVSRLGRCGHALGRETDIVDRRVAGS